MNEYLVINLCYRYDTGKFKLWEIVKGSFFIQKVIIKNRKQGKRLNVKIQKLFHQMCRRMQRRNRLKVQNISSPDGN